ncbi:MAG: hypothetical protein ACFFDS_08585 [Candidatus Thorarchaeota archaeon]
MNEEKKNKIDTGEVERNPVIATLWVGLIVGVIGVLGIIISQVALGGNLFRIFLGVFLAGVLICFFALILRRLRRKGIEYFVIGAITAYIGFLLLAFPALFATMNIQLFEFQYAYYILMGGGVFLIIFGFFMETYDLNEKIIELCKRIWIALKNLLKKLNWKMILSPWNLLSVAGIIVIILTAEEIILILPVVFYIIGSVLILSNFIIHFREEFVEVLKNIGNIFYTFFKAWAKAIKQIPRIIKKLVEILYDPERFKRMIRWVYKQIKLVGRAIKYIVVRNYVFLFAFGIAMFFILNIPRIALDFEIRLSLASLVCFIAIVKPLLDWREHFGEEISSARMFLYKTTQKTRNVFKRRDIIRCPHCNYSNIASRRVCWNCKEQIPNCWICNGVFEPETEVAVCPNCKNNYHIKHLKAWLRFNPTCPVCHEPIEKIETEIYLPGYYTLAKSTDEEQIQTET